MATGDIPQESGLRRLSSEAPTYTRLVSREPELRQALIDVCLASARRANPAADHPDAALSKVVAAWVSRVLCAIRDGRDVTDGEIVELLGPLTECYAEERVPLRAFISVVFGCMDRAWAEAAATAEPADLPDVVTLGHMMFDLLGRATIALAQTHAGVEQSIYSVEREARRMLCTALVRGAPAADLAVLAHTSIAGTYRLIALHVDATGPVRPNGVNALSRRRIRLTQAALDDLAGTTALHNFDGTTGIALLADEERHCDRARYRLLSEDLAERLRAQVIVVDFGPVRLDALPGAVTEILEFAELAHRLGRPTGVYLPDDLMLEYQLVRPGPARDRLAARIRPLLDHRHLLEALEAHIEHGWNRKRAADRIHLHPTSFGYRLRRIAEVTGLDPNDPHQSRLLAAALVVYRLHPIPSWSPGSGP